MIIATKYDAKLEPLFAAVENGNMRAVKDWVDDGNPVYNPDSKHESVLALSVRKGFFSLAEFFLDCGDWRKYQDELDSALKIAIGDKHLDCIRLLLDRGANPNAPEWYAIFATHSRELAGLFFDAGKDADGFECALDGIETGLARAVKESLPSRPELEVPILRKMYECLKDVWRHSPDPERLSSYSEYRLEHDEMARKHAERVFGLLKWTGVNTRRPFEDEYGEEMNLLREAVIRGSIVQIRALAPKADDLPAICEAIRERVGRMDDKLVELFLKIGWKINDREDGTSSLLEMALEKCDFPRIMLCVKNGAKTGNPPQKVLGKLRQALYGEKEPPQGIVLALSKILRRRDLEMVLTHPDAKKRLGANVDNVLDRLYLDSRPVSRDEILEKLAAAKQELKTLEWSKYGKEFRVWCHRSDRTPDPEWVKAILKREKQLYDFRGYEGSKATRNWALVVVNALFKELQAAGAKITFPIEPRGPYDKGERPVVRTAISMNGETMYFVVREIEIHPKWYQLREEDSRYYSDATHSGRLKIVLHGNRGCPSDIASETELFQFRGQCKKLVASIEKFFAREHRQRLAREEEERKREEEEIRRNKEWLESYEQRRRNEAEAARKAAQEAALREQLLKIRREENERYATLLKMARRREERTLISAFLDDLQQEWTQSGMSPERQKWLESSRALLDKLNPAAAKEFLAQEREDDDGGTPPLSSSLGTW